MCAHTSNKNTAHRLEPDHWQDIETFTEPTITHVAIDKNPSQQVSVLMFTKTKALTFQVAVNNKLLMKMLQPGEHLPHVVQHNHFLYCPKF
jgi:hypothetical protein